MMNRLGVVLAVFFLATYFGSTTLMDDWFVAVDTTNQTQTSNGLDADNPLRVLPAQGDPIPLSDFNLQGSVQTQQETAGDLQTPQTVDDLQPNSRTDLFNDDL